MLAGAHPEALGAVVLLEDHLDCEDELLELTLQLGDGRRRTCLGPGLGLWGQG